MGSAQNRGQPHLVMSSPPKTCTAKPVFDSTAVRLRMDPKALTYIFGECLQAVLAHAEIHSSCVIRTHGRFRQLRPGELGEGATVSMPSKVLVFERPKRASVNRSGTKP